MPTRRQQGKGKATTTVPVREINISQLKEQLNQLIAQNRGNQEFKEYIQVYCACRLSYLGIEREGEEANFSKLDRMVKNWTEKGGTVVLPSIFEKVKIIIFALKEKEDIYEVLKKVDTT